MKFDNGFIFFLSTAQLLNKHLCPLKQPSARLDFFHKWFEILYGRGMVWKSCCLSRYVTTQRASSFNVYRCSAPQTNANNNLYAEETMFGHRFPYRSTYLTIYHKRFKSQSNKIILRRKPLHHFRLLEEENTCQSGDDWLITTHFAQFEFTDLTASTHQ